MRWRFGTLANVNLLGAANNLGHVAADGGGGRAGIAEHAVENIGIQHTVYRDMVRGGIETGDPAHCFDQRLAMVGAGAADEGAIDVE